MNSNPNLIEELAEKYASQYFYVEHTREHEGWGDSNEVKKVLLTNLIKKAFEELE